MAYSNLQLNVTANTARALADFKKFSSTLDNKFLISGLKLDVVRNALSQINREFQKSIGEQGLASASSLRAAQNQASLLTQTFKGFASESARAINRDIGTALNTIAVKAGGTMKDVQKTLSATPFISTRISTDLRNQLISGMMSFQRDARRAGLGDNFSGIARQFLSGQVMGRDLISSDNPLAQFLGSEIMKRSGGQTTIYDPKARSEILAQIVGDKDIQDQLKRMAKQTYGYRIILEDLNSQLFNTEKGVFGSLRKVIDKTGKATTIFDEVYKLVEQVFGPNGTFKALFSSIAKVFKIGDPLRPFIDAVQFVTKKFGEMAAYFLSDKFTGFLEKLKPVIDRIVNIGRGIYETFSKLINEVFSGTFSQAEVKEGIRSVGKSIREYIQYIGKTIRGADTDKLADFSGGIIGTLVTEVGKTTITLIREIFSTFVNKAPDIAEKVLPALNSSINSLLTEVFGEFGGKLAKLVMATMPGPIGAIARASTLTDMTGGQGNLGLLAAAAPFLLAGGGGLAGIAGRTLRGTGAGATAFRTLGLGLLGADPTLSLAMGFAPQLLGGVPGAFGRVNTVRNQFLNSRAAAYLSGYGSSAINATGSFSRGIPGMLSSYGGSAANLVLPYLQGARSNASNIASSVGGRFNLLQGFLRSQSSQFMAGFKPPTPPTSGGGGFRIKVPKTPLAGFTKAVGRATSRVKNKLDFLRASTGETSYSDPIGPQYDPNSPSSKRLGLPDVPWVFDRRTGKYEPRLMSSPDPNIRRQRVIARRNRIYGLRGRLGRFLRRPGSGGWAAGSVASTFALNALQQKADAAQQEEGTTGFLGSLGSGALQGASIGMAAGPWGALAGAAVGAGAAALMDKGFRDSIGQFLQNIGTSLTDVGKTFGNWMKTIFKGLANGLLVVANAVISSTLFVPRVVSQLIGSIPGIDRIPGVKNSLQGIQSGLSYQIPYFYGGKNFAGPALSLESKMSGRNPMIVNDGEFVIPNNGFTTLADLVSQRVRSTQPTPEPPLQLQLNINLTSTALVTDPDELTKALRPAVIQIVNDAWDKATQKRILRPKIA